MTKVLELITDVKNPHPDRRSRDWNKQPVLAKGQRFTLHDGREWKYVYSSDHRYHSEPVVRADGLGQLIVSNSVAVEPKTFTEFARVYGDDLDPDTIARVLFKLGVIKRTDFEIAAAAFNDENFKLD